MDNLDLSILAPICAMILAGTIVRISLPRILLLSLRKKIVDPIDSRKVHKSTASRLGGVSFYPAIFMAFSLSLYFLDLFSVIDINITNVLNLELSAMLMLYLIGLYDDIVGVKYKIKFKVQILTAVLVVVSGTYLEAFYGVTDTWVMPFYLTAPLTVLLIVFITNAINLIDGINGLASMLSILALLVYGGLFNMSGDIVYSTVCFASAGALIPFWYSNVFGIRRRTTARIFMGDCGALVIGFILSIMAIKIWNLDININHSITANQCHILAYTMLFIPCLDVIRIVLHRYRMKQPLFLPDKNHIHHKFMALGFTPRTSLWVIIVIQIVFVLINVLLSYKMNLIYIFIVDVVIWTYMHLALTKKIKKHELENKE